MKKLITKLLKMLPTAQPRTDLERFIVSRNPSSVAEVEHLTNSYYRKQHSGFTNSICATSNWR